MPLPFAVPSCVFPGTVARNAHALAGRVAEVGLCFFETHATCAYTHTDIPPELAALPLQWHVHLPIDMPWARGGAEAASVALTVFNKAGHLSPRLAVLHPPDGPLPTRCALLHDFARAWNTYTTVPLLLENICGHTLTDVPLEILNSFKICLDVGHLLAYNQYDMLCRRDLMERVVLLHWSAPGAGDQHLPLTALTPQQKQAACDVVKRVPASARHMIEVFHWASVEASVPVLADILGASWPQ